MAVATIGAQSTQVRTPEPAPWSRLAEPVFQLVASISGLNGTPYTGAATSLAQDGDGFLWIGTQTGLQRWDGYHFRTYTSADAGNCALPADVILSLHMDAKRRLWIGTWGGGLARYDRDKDCFRVIAAGPDGLSSPTVKTIADDGAGGLWVGTANGLDHLDPDESHVMHFGSGAGGDGRLLGYGVEAILRDRDGALWVSTSPALVRRGPAGGDFARVPMPSGEGVASQPRALFQGSDGRIWVGTISDGIYVIDPKTLEARPVPDTQRRAGVSAAVAAAETPTGEIWFATHGSGIVAVDPSTLQARAIRRRAGVPTSPVDDTVEAIYRDRSGLMWIASLRGVGYFVQQGIMTVLGSDDGRGVPASGVTTTAAMPDDRIALGTERGDIVLLDPIRSRVETVRLDSLGSKLVRLRDGVFALAAAGGQELFAGIRPIGLVWIDAGAHRSALVTLPGPRPVEPIYGLQPDGQRLWVCGLDGVWLLARRATAVASGAYPWEVVDRLKMQSVFAMASPPGDFIWFGTLHGLFRFERSSRKISAVHLAAAAHGASADPFVVALLIDRRGRLWAGTNAQGIFVLDPSAVRGNTIVPEKQINEGLPSLGIDQLLEDASGNVWAATDRGIARIDPVRFSVRSFGRGDGLAISGYWRGAGAISLRGELLLGGVGGLTVVRADRVDPPPDYPPIVITSITVGHQTMASALYNAGDATPTLRIPADAKGFSVEFAALDYSEPEQNAYAYMLEGYDRTWMRAAVGNRMAAYTNLSPGQYRLRLRATDHAGVLVPIDKVLPIEVAAAWYQTPWFYLVEVLAGLGLVTAILRYARKRELRALELRRTADLAHAAEERNALIENVAHDLRTPLTSLRGYLETLRLKDASLATEDRQTYLGIAFRQSERLSRLVRELFDLVRLERARVAPSPEQLQLADLVQDVIQEFQPIAENRKISFDVTGDSDRLLVTGDIDLIQRMVDNLLDNAVRHTPVGGLITVRLGADDQWLQLDITDTGKGIEGPNAAQVFDRYMQAANGGRRAAGGVGLGLAIVKQIVELHGGTIEVHSETGVGTRFSVRLPLANSGAAPLP